MLAEKERAAVIQFREWVKAFHAGDIERVRQIEREWAKNSPREEIHVSLV